MTEEKAKNILEQLSKKKNSEKFAEDFVDESIGKAYTFLKNNTVRIDTVDDIQEFSDSAYAVAYDFMLQNGIADPSVYENNIYTAIEDFFFAMIEQ